MKQYLTENEIVVDCFEDAATLAQILLKNGYVAMISEEEQFYIVNYVWCSGAQANRNEVIFRSRADYEMETYYTSKEED